MSAFDPKADLCGTNQISSYAPQADIAHEIRYHHAGRLQPRAADRSIFAQPAIARAPIILVVVRPTLFYDIAYVPKNKERKGRHALFLLLAKGLIERLPRIGEVLQVGRSLSQGVRAPLHEIDRIAVAQDFGRTFVNFAAHRFC